MAQEIIAGQFDAKVADYGIGTTQQNKPMAMVRFDYLDKDNHPHSINWYGSFNEGKAMEITAEALTLMGFRGTNPADLAAGSGSGVLNEQNQVSITIKPDTYDGKTRMKVAYVNPLGGGGFRDLMDKGAAVQAFSGINCGAAFAAAQQKVGQQNQPPTHGGQFQNQNQNFQNQNFNNQNQPLHNYAPNANNNGAQSPQGFGNPPQIDPNEQPPF